MIGEFRQVLASLRAKVSNAFTKRQEMASILNEAKVDLASGNFELASRHASRILSSKSASRTSHLVAEFLLVQVRSRQGLFSGVLDQLNSLYERVPRTNVALQAMVGNEIVRTCFRSGNLGIGAQRGEALYREHEKDWPSVEIVELLCQLSSCHYHRGDTERAEEVVVKALALAESSKSPKSLTQSYWQSCVLSINRGDLVLALQFVLDAKHWAQIAGLQQVLPKLNYNAALIMLDLPNPDFETIQRLAEATYLDLSSQNNAEGVAYVRTNLSELALRHEDCESALLYAQRGLNEIPQEIPGPKAPLLVQVAKVFARMGNFTEAPAQLRAAVDHMESLEPSRELAKQWGHIARVYVEVGLTDRGVYAYEKAIQMSGLLREEQEAKVNQVW